MKSNKEFVILLEIFVITFLVLSVVSVCGLSESSTNCPIFGLANSGSTEVTATPDTPWMYYRAVTIKENSGTALTNYQVLVELNPSNFPDKAKSDGSDLRFVEDGKELGYWIEDYDAGAKTAKIWVKVSSIPANGEAKIKMYYGKDKAGSVSDGDATFEFFDDFGGTSLDWNKWRKTGGDLADAEITVSSSILTIEGSGTEKEYLESKTFTTSMPVIFTTKQRDYTAVHYPCEFGFGYRHHGGSSNCVLKLIYTADEFCLHNHAGTGASSTSRVPDDDEYHIWDLVWTSGKTELFRDEDIQGSLTTNIPSTTLHISLGHPETVAPNPWKGSFDWIFVRKYATPEPTLSISKELSTQKDSSLTPTPTPPEGGLVGYWNFNEGSGNIAYDSSGSGNDGTIHGATFVSGISGQALSFDGKDDYVSAPVDINPTVMPQMTITAWVRADDDSGTIVSHDDGGFDRTIDIDTRGGGKGWSAFSGSGVVGYSPVTIGEWFFLAAVYDQSTETVKLYVNGALISEEKGKLGSGWDYINIGKNPSFGDYFSGTVDEVMIYNYDLTKSEVKSIYEGGEAPEEEESGYGDIKVTYISREEVQEKYTVSYDETFKYDDDGDGANEATLYYNGENNLVMSSDDTDKDGKVDLIFHYDDEEYLTRAIRDTDGDGELDQILHFNREEEIIKVEKIRNE